jgi:hypothetical protein
VILKIVILKIVFIKISRILFFRVFRVKKIFEITFRLFCMFRMFRILKKDVWYNEASRPRSSPFVTSRQYNNGVAIRYDILPFQGVDAAY